MENTKKLNENNHSLNEASVTDILKIKKENNLNAVPPPPPPNNSNKKEESNIAYSVSPKKQVPRDETKMANAEKGKFINFKQSEHLRVAQKKIKTLEEKITQLFIENEELASTTETLKNLNDEYFSNIESLKSKLSDQKETNSKEIQLLREINRNKDKEINKHKQQVEEYQIRIGNDFQKVRKREKELEHRLEIVKMEEAALIKSKDQLILDLKKRVDELSLESNNFRKKNQRSYEKLNKKQKTIRKVVQTLRLALTALEGDDQGDFDTTPKTS